LEITPQLKNKLMRKFTVILLIFITLISCKTNKEATANGKKSTRQSEAKVRLFRTTFLNANKQKMLGNNEQAITEFEKCKTLRPKNAASLYELSKLHQAKGNTFLAIEEVKKASEINPKNKWYLFQLGNLQFENQAYKEASLTFEKYIEIDAKNTEVLEKIQYAYVQNKEYKKAARVFDLLANIVGKSAEISFQKYKLFRNKMDIKNAFLALDEALALDSIHGEANFEYAKYYQKMKNPEKTFFHMRRVFKDVYFNTDTKLLVLQEYTNYSNEPKIKDYTEKLLKTMVETHPESVKPYVAYGDFYNIHKQQKKAREFYLKGTEFAKKSFPLWVQIIEIDARQKNHENLLKDSEKALESYPLQPVLYLYKGMAHNNLKNYKKAVSAFKSGKSLVLDNDKLLFDFYSNIGSVYNELKEFSKSDEAFENAISIKNNEPFLLNNYSYYLSVRNEKLDRALEMVKKANEISPNNPSFNDTYGWIFFQKGNYADAEIWLKKSMENGGANNGEVLEHYGDVMSKQNKPEKAMEYWKKAKQLGGTSNKIDLKISTKKYVE